MNAINTQKRRSQQRRDSEMRQFVSVARARQASMSGREDLPADPLGYLYGHDMIEQYQYEAGRRFEFLAGRVYPSPHGKAANLGIKSETPADAPPEKPNPFPMTDDDAELTLEAMEAELKALGRRTFDLVNNIVFHGRWWNQRSYRVAAREIARLKDGLDAISEVRTVRMEAAE